MTRHARFLAESPVPPAGSRWLCVCGKRLRNPLTTCQVCEDVRAERLLELARGELDGSDQ